MPHLEPEDLENDFFEIPSKEEFFKDYPSDTDADYYEFIEELTELNRIKSINQ